MFRQSEDSDGSGSDVDLEELFEVTYVEDYMDAIDLVDDLARNNSKLLEVHCKQLEWLTKIENQMSALLGPNAADEVGMLDHENMSVEQKQALRELEDLLVKASQTGDAGARASDDVSHIVADKLHFLTMDEKNLTDERTKHDPNKPKDAPHSRNVNKPSINPNSKEKTHGGIPTKLNFSANENDNNNDYDHPKPSLPFAVSDLSSPTPSFESFGSFEHKLDSNPDPPVKTKDTRYRSCKFRNVPIYVFPTRAPNSNFSTPKKSPPKSETSAKSSPASKTAKENDGRKAAGSATSSRKRSMSSQGSNSKRAPQEANTSDNSDDDDSASTVSGESLEPTYCLCEEESHGKMVQCDNELCPIEWFHFSCVQLKKIPRGNWYCPRCRGENSEVMKPKSEFLKELDEYNKQKAEESCNKSDK